MRAVGERERELGRVASWARKKGERSGGPAGQWRASWACAASRPGGPRVVRVGRWPFPFAHSFSKSFLFLITISNVLHGSYTCVHVLPTYTNLYGGPLGF